MLGAKIASAQNKIIQNSQFKKKVRVKEQKAQKEDRFIRGIQIAFMIYDYFRVTGAHDTVLIYSLLLFVMTTFRNVKQDGTSFYYRCQKIPSDEILESPYKFRIRESDQLKTVLELYEMEIHQTTSVPNYRKLKTMAKR